VRDGDGKDNGDWWKVEARIIKKTSSQLRRVRFHRHCSCVERHALPGQVRLLFNLARAKCAKLSHGVQESLSYNYVNVSWKVIKVVCCVYYEFVKVCIL